MTAIKIGEIIISERDLSVLLASANGTFSSKFSASNDGISISRMDAKISILPEIVKFKDFLTLDKVKSLYDTEINPALYSYMI